MDDTKPNRPKLTVIRSDAGVKSLIQTLMDDEAKTESMLTIHYFKEREGGGDVLFAGLSTTDLTFAVAQLQYWLQQRTFGDGV